MVYLHYYLFIKISKSSTENQSNSHKNEIKENVKLNKFLNLFLRVKSRYAISRMFSTMLDNNNDYLIMMCTL